MPLFGDIRFDRFVRTVAGLDVDRQDITPFRDFVHHQLYDVLLIAQVTAESNGRGVVQTHDLPITKGLRENIHAFRKTGEDVELGPVLTELAGYPPLARGLSTQTETRLPVLVGGLSLALARTLVTIDPQVRSPQSKDWERAFAVFDLLV